MLYNTHEMPLLDGVHHVTFLTEDIERLAAFYGRVFDAARTFDETEEGVRHGCVRFGDAPAARVEDRGAELSDDQCPASGW